VPELIETDAVVSVPLDADVVVPMEPS